MGEKCSTGDVWDAEEGGDIALYDFLVHNSIRCLLSKFSASISVNISVSSDGTNPKESSSHQQHITTCHLTPCA